MRRGRVILTALSPFDPSPFQELGYEPFRISTIKLIPKREEIQRLKENLSVGRHDSVAIMSPRSIGLIRPSKRILYNLSKMRLYAVGPSTKESLERFGLTDVRLPCEFTSEALANIIISDHSKSPFSSIALIRSGYANILMSKALSEGGVPFEEYRIYSPVVDPKGVNRFLKAVRIGAEFVVFTSSSSFELMRAYLQPEARKEFESLLKTLKTVAIGPETARSLKLSGIDPLITPNHSLSGVISFLKVM